jgi:hypothetical protein
LKKILMVSTLGLSVILASCGLFPVRIDLPGDNPVGLNGKSFDVGVSGAGRPELMSTSRTPVALEKPITGDPFPDTPGITLKLNENGFSVGNIREYGACMKFTGTAELTTTVTPIPAAITLSDVSVELSMKDAAVPLGLSFIMKTAPATAAVTLGNQAGTNKYTFDANSLQLCFQLEGAKIAQLVSILESGGANTASGKLKYSLDGVSGLTNSTLKLTFGTGSSYINVSL